MEKNDSIKLFLEWESLNSEDNKKLIADAMSAAVQLTYENEAAEQLRLVQVIFNALVVSGNIIGELEKLSHL